MDAAGIVDEAAKKETGVKVGDRVMAMVCPQAQHGAYREQIVLEARGRPCTGRDHACRSLYFADERPDGTAVPRSLGPETGSGSPSCAAGAYGGYVYSLRRRRA